MGKAFFVMSKISETCLPGLLQPLKDSAEFQKLAKSLEISGGYRVVFGLSGAQRALIMAGLIDARHGAVLIITPAAATAQLLVADLQALLPGREVLFYPAGRVAPLAGLNQVDSQRLKVLTALIQGRAPVVVASIAAVTRRLVPAKVFKAGCRRLKTRQQIDLAETKEFLVRLGYQRLDLVTVAGQFAVRGDVLDIYPATATNPVRVALWDDQIEAMHTFDSHSQHLLAELTVTEIMPVGETIVASKDWLAGRQRLKQEYQHHLKKLHQSAYVDAQHQLTSQVEAWLNKLAQSVPVIVPAPLLPFFYPHPVNLWDYLPVGGLVLLDAPLQLKEVAETLKKEGAETHSELLIAGKALPAQHAPDTSWTAICAQLKNFTGVGFSFLPRQTQFPVPARIISFVAKAAPAFLGQLKTLGMDIKHWKKTNNIVVLLVANEQRAENLRQTLQEDDIVAFLANQHNLTKQLVPGNVVIITGDLTAGFELPAARLVLITEKEIFEQRKIKSSTPKTLGRLASLEELKTNDYVVHIGHGIGRYRGLTTLDVGGIQKDYLLVEYAGDDRIYVPTDQVDLLQRYLGKEAVKPKLAKLGGNEWHRAKSKVKKAVQEMAVDLLALYAQRQKVKGHAFEVDTVWQKEFELDFPYQETPGQLKAIQEIKRDMEIPRPMDRLLCGDVGYGKTEVALRAVFKAVSDGKQVAVLVPTTILAQQHYHTFRERFVKYPVKIEMISRFRSPKEQRLILAGIKAGTIDVLIGTHRLVQKDVAFKNLGLVVIDEEQRFGVAHKEKLKQIRTAVDVLTLTATPIPRTLHMSLVGIRDTSVLEHPPADRLPVQSYVLEEEPQVIQAAIRRELDRGGQVFFLHNRVTELVNVAHWLNSLVPEASMVIAHGQMKEEQLEKIMLEFIAGEHDILVCTTIIETGLDLPNVNTLIVKNADNFGLAQLYQLRGRVGRSSRQAHAYFTFRRDKILVEVAEKRLSAIKEFTEFGSGYKIAMRDLQIRGAGNILGAQQHGQIAEVGFSLYCQMLEQAVQEVKGEVVAVVPGTVVELPVDAGIPDQYVKGDQNQKLDLYRRIAAISSKDELHQLEVELQQHDHEMPGQVQRLLLVARIKNRGGQLKAKAINYQQEVVCLIFHANPSLDMTKLVQLAERYPNQVKFQQKEAGFEIKFKLKSKSPLDGTALKKLLDFMEEL
ncbi:MAG: transcription-repair coupling factor [Desulfotomaculum sp.]|nr:transcription-repair coupling factor [Desulfotomaculum sp.]